MSCKIIACIKTQGLTFIGRMHDLTFAIRLGGPMFGADGDMYNIGKCIVTDECKQKGSNLHTGFNYKDAIRSMFRILVVNVGDVLFVNATT